MRICGPMLLLLMASGAVAADRHKPDIDPESQDGILIQHIQQEPLAPRKLALLEKFVQEYPQASSMAWVYEQLLPIYQESQQVDKELATAQNLLALDPAELDAAHHALRASEAKNDPVLIQTYAQLAWDLASKAAQSPKPVDEDDLAAWTKLVGFARDVMNYSEYVLYSQARESADPQKKMEWIQALEQRNPQSKYIVSAKQDYFHAFQQTQTREETVALAEQRLSEEPDNEDLLMTAAQYDLDHEREFPKVLSYSQRILDIVEHKPQPDTTSPEAWAAKKSQYAGLANWMIGVVHAKDGRWGQSDRYLRAALPQIHEDKLLAAAYYYLGYDNYAIAVEQHDKRRAEDALKYLKLSAATSGPFQSPAQKNLEALRSEFSFQ